MRKSFHFLIAALVILGIAAGSAIAADNVQIGRAHV